jgi:ribonuclease D
VSEPVFHHGESVTDSRRLAAIVKHLSRQPTIGIDTESNGFFRYPERVCLIQISDKNDVFLVDPLEIEDMAPLGTLLANPKVEKIVHSADYDLRSLDRDWGFRIVNIFDTSVGARFAGMERLGLGAILEEYLGVVLAKEKRLQRADWSIRPLSTAALDYAAADVTYLLPLRAALAAHIEKLGRTAWVAEENARVEEIRHSPSDPEMAFFSIKGSRSLDGRGLAVLQELARLREREALRRGRPPFRVLSNETLVALATDPKAELKGIRGLTPGVLSRLGGDLRKAIKVGLAAPPVQRPAPEQPPLLRPTPKETDRLKKLREWRTAEGKRATIDPSIVWPMASLDRLARSPGSLDHESTSADVRRWQVQEFSASLRGALEVL